LTAKERAHLFISANTHPGMKGKNNEDRYAVSTHRLGKRNNIPSVLAVVCDGIGGHRAGEVAAEIAVETISRAVAKADAQQPLEILNQAIQEASASIHTEAEANPERQGMGATCVCTWIIGDRLYTASVGDSRLYLVRGDTIQQLTTDHTWIQEAIEFGALTPEQARNHPNAHVIRRYLGSKSPVEVDFRIRLQPEETNEQALTNQGMHLLPGDILVLCSDGLTDLVEKDEIYATLKEKGRENALQVLTDLANQRGGHDNITMVALEAPANLKPASESTGAQTPVLARRLALPCAIIAIIGILTAAVAGGLFWYFSLRELPPPAVLTPSTTPTVLPALETVLPATEEGMDTPAAPMVPPKAKPTSTRTEQPEAGTMEATYTPWPTNTLPPQPTTNIEIPATATETSQP
jgi:PPM family protein phosphatase